MRVLNVPQFWAGSIFIALGVFFGGYAAMTLEFGSARQMGPGYFPVVLSGLLVVLGAIAMIGAAGASGEKISWAPPRALALILLAPLVFGAAIDGLGLFPTVMIGVVLTSYASRLATWRYTLLLSVLVAAFCGAIFNLGLGVPIPLFGIWVTGLWT